MVRMIIGFLTYDVPGNDRIGEGFIGGT